MSPLNQLPKATRRLIAGLVTTLVVVLGFGAIAFASSDGSGQRNLDSPKPTIALVYIAAFAPDQGESLLQLVTMNPGSELGPPTLLTRPYPLADGTQGTDL